MRWSASRRGGRIARSPPGSRGGAQGAVVEIEGGGFALVTALCRDHVELVPLSIIEPVRHAVTAILRSCRSTAAGGARIPMNRTSLPTRPPARG